MCEITNAKLLLTCTSEIRKIWKLKICFVVQEMIINLMDYISIKEEKRETIWHTKAVSLSHSFTLV